MTTRSPQAENRSSIPWEDIRTEWREREYGTLRRAMWGLVGKETRNALHDLLFSEDAPTPDEARSTLLRAFKAASESATSIPDGEPLVALYMYGLCLQKWEKTEDYDRVREVLEALEAVGVATAAGGDRRGQLLSVVVRQAQLVRPAMRVENAMSCSCPVAMRALSRVIVEDLTSLGEEQALLQGSGELRALIRSDAATSRLYFQTLDNVADAVLSFVMDDPSGPATLDAALAQLREAERHEALVGDVYDSELRAHRASLEALRDHAGGPHLQVDAADVVYIYPFTLEPAAADELAAPLQGIHDEFVRRARDDDADEKLESAGFRPASAKKLELNDLWDRDGPSEPGYSGTSITLPSITVETTAYEWLEEDDRAEARLTFSSEARLSRLGNHHVRVWRRLQDAGLHDVNQALRRGSDAMGVETLTSPGHSDQWKGIADYAGDVIRAIADALDAEPVTDLDATFHVVLAARSITLQPAGGAPATPDQLERALGATLLFHPIRHLATSLEEWVRYPAPTVTNLLGNEGYVDDLVVRTDNTTVLYMPHSPEWLIEEYQEMIEFAASIPPLLTLWAKQARTETSRVETRLREDVLPKLEREFPFLQKQADPVLEEQAQKPAPDESDPIGDLYKQQMEIRALESRIRADLAYLRSPALCRTRGQRRFLDALGKAAELPRLERELERELRLLADQHERVSAMVSSIDDHYRREQQKRSERYELPAKIVFGLLAAASLVGVIQWLNDEFGVDATPWIALEAVGVLLVALAIGGLIAYQARRSG